MTYVDDHSYDSFGPVSKLADNAGSINAKNTQEASSFLGLYIVNLDIIYLIFIFFFFLHLDK